MRNHRLKLKSHRFAFESPTSWKGGRTDRSRVGTDRAHAGACEPGRERMREHEREGAGPGAAPACAERRNKKMSEYIYKA